MKLTVIIRDDSPYINLGEPVKHRSVTLDLTEEQQKSLRLIHEGEEISFCFFEPEVPKLQNNE